MTSTPQVQGCLTGLITSRTTEMDSLKSITEVADGLARHDTNGEDMDESSPVLHSVIWMTAASPMWEYTTDLVLLKVHNLLAIRGIVYRDIGAGNVMLARVGETAREGEEVFLTEFESATVPSGLPLEVEENNALWQVPQDGNTEVLATAGQNKMLVLSKSLRDATMQAVCSTCWPVPSPFGNLKGRNTSPPLP